MVFLTKDIINKAAAHIFMQRLDIHFILYYGFIIMNNRIAVVDDNKVRWLLLLYTETEYDYR